MAKKSSKLKSFLTATISIVLGVAIGFLASVLIALPDSYKIPEPIAGKPHSVATGNIDVEVVKNEELSVHFLELGNKYTGDCTFIKVDDVEVLIDAGSKASSIPTIKKYVDKYCEDGILEYVIVTHAHEDHYAGFATNESTDSLFDLFEVKTIIDFSNTNKTTSNKMYANYIRERDAEVAKGAKHFTALECVNNYGEAQKVFNLGNAVTLEILEHAYYTVDADTENEYSVCTLLSHRSTKHYLFTGDLEEAGEESLVAMNPDLPKVDVYKAGHHGSKTSSSAVLMEKIQPKIVCVCCCAGSSEYTSKNENQFPTQEFVNNVTKYTKNIFVTTLCEDYKAGKFVSFNGNIVVCSSGTNDVVVSCSNNNTILPDTDWFKKNRKLPADAVA